MESVFKLGFKFEGGGDLIFLEVLKDKGLEPTR